MNATERMEEARRDLAGAEDRLRIVIGGEAKYTGSANEYDSWKKSRDAAQAELARCRLVVEQREQDIDAEAREAWRKAKSQQLRVNDTLAKRMRSEGPDLLKTILSWVEEIAAAETETARINARVPAGEDRLAGPDALARSVEMQPEKIVREVDVELWVHAETGEIISDQRAVVAKSKTEGSVGTWRTPCVRRAFREVTYLPDAAVQRATPFLQALRLPAFDSPRMIWNGDAASQPARIQQMLEAASATAPKQPDRQKQTRFVAVAPWQPPSAPLRPVGYQKTDADRQLKSAAGAQEGQEARQPEAPLAPSRGRPIPIAGSDGHHKN